MNLCRGFALLLFGSAFSLAQAAALLTCSVSSANVLVRSEGMAERLGDLQLDCAGTPGASIAASLTVLLSANVTNRVSTGNVVDAVLTVDTGAGPVSAGATPLLGGPNAVLFSNIGFDLPASGRATLRISNLRGAVADRAPGDLSPITASISTSNPGLLSVHGAPFPVGTPMPSLLAGSVSTLVSCYGAQVPDQISVTSLFGSAAALTMLRLSEGFGAAFMPRGLGDDAGTRFRIEFSGFPTGARVFVPDAIAGSTATEPTGSGLLHLARSGGIYTPGHSQLLLVRVLGADDTGAGGHFAFTPSGSDPIALDGAADVPLTGGAGNAVYEVVSGDPILIESAEIPTWVGIPASSADPSVAPRQSVSLAPLSDVAVASASAPVPRYIAVAPPADCGIAGDCADFPTLQVQAPPLEFTGQVGGRPSAAWVQIQNTGGGFLAWTASVTYTSGSNWIVLTRDGNSLEVKAWARYLTPGIYQAVVTIDAGPAGQASLPVKLTVSAAANATGPQIDSVVHPATLQSGPLVPGSLAMIQGQRLGGNSVSVTLDGQTARVVYAGAAQILMEVPASLSGHTSTQLKVIADGVSSPALTVPVATASPGIFPGAILNQDNTANNGDNPAAGSTVVQMWGTGLPPADVATVNAKVHDQWLAPQYAGPAPGVGGVQQVNVLVPAGLGRMNTTVVVCATLKSSGTRVCGPESPISVK